MKKAIKMVPGLKDSINEEREICTDKNENEIFLIYEEIQMGLVAISKVIYI